MKRSARWLNGSLFASFLLLAATAARGEDWPGWRGELGSGQYPGKLPVSWTDKDVVWRAALPGKGQSSPVVWKDRIFLTSATGEGRQRIVFCLARDSGKLLWQQTAWEGEPEKSHGMNHWASATCVTDGERVVAFFGKGGIHAYDVEGKPLWSRELGTFESPWGTAASPIIVGDQVIQNCDADDEAYLLGLDKTSGKTLWKTPRYRTRGWSTPLLVQTEDGRELLLNGEKGVNAYDPQSGKDLWFCKVDRGRGTPTVVPFEKMLIAVSGRPGDMVAMRPGGRGDVSSTHEVWRTNRRGARDLPSPIVVGPYLLVVSLRPGIATCYQAASGKELWKQRLDGNFSASPIAAGGLVYIPNESGTVFVIRPGEKADVVAKNQVASGDDEVFRASLAPSNGQLLLRSDGVLYCIGK